ncbi:MAG TPA: lipocalin-like domain-containing protein [Vicinamibacterales bacterium]|jgi:hypothetical protein|nr:lipocalin-like domain-containing protein [Vicinamibacterales bacterium]
MWRIVIAAAALASVCGGVTRAQTPGDREAAQRFVGAWHLVSWTERLADRTTRPAATDVGYLMFTDGNRMCAVLASSKRAPWTGPARTIEEATARTTGFVSYCAQFEVHAVEGFVKYTEDLDLNPRTVGIVRKRWFTFDGPDRLKLTIDPAERGTLQDSSLIWERARAK